MPANDDRPDQHTHEGSGHCETCGHQHRVERAYKSGDRLLRALFLALARKMDLEAYSKGRKASATIYVAAPDSASLDRFDARLAELAPRLDAELMKLVQIFVKTHVGVDLRVREP